MQYSVMNKHFFLHADKFYDVRGISHVYLDFMFHPISNVQQGNLVLELFEWIYNLT